MHCSPTPPVDTTQESAYYRRIMQYHMHAIQYQIEVARLHVVEAFKHAEQS